MSGLAHCLHLIMTIIFWPWLFVWIICAAGSGNSRKKVDDKKRDEQIELLKQLVKEKK